MKRAETDDVARRHLAAGDAALILTNTANLLEQQLEPLLLSEESQLAYVRLKRYMKRLTTQVSKERDFTHRTLVRRANKDKK